MNGQGYTECIRHIPSKKKKKKTENNSSVWKEHTTNKSWKTFTLSYKDFKKKLKNLLVSRDLNVTSHCPTNTIQKVPNFSTFMRPHSILQCLVSVVKSAHIYKHVRQQFIYLTWKQLAFSPPEFHLTLAFFFFFLAMQHPTADGGLKTIRWVAHSLQKALDSHQCAQYKTPDSPLHKSGGRFGTQVNRNNRHN